MAVLPRPARVAGAFVRGRVAAAFLVGRSAGARVPAERRSVAAACRRFALLAGAAVLPALRGFGDATGAFAGCFRLRAGASAVALALLDGRRPVADFGAFADGACLRPAVGRSGFAALAAPDLALDLPDFLTGAGRPLRAAGRSFVAVRVASDLGASAPRVVPPALAAPSRRAVARAGLPFDAGAPAGGGVTSGTSGDRFAGRLTLPTRSLLPLFLSATRRSVARLWFGESSGCKIAPSGERVKHSERLFAHP